MNALALIKASDVVLVAEFADGRSSRATEFLLRGHLTADGIGGPAGLQRADVAWQRFP
jgi:hypothetical protein